MASTWIDGFAGVLSIAIVVSMPLRSIPRTVTGLPNRANDAGVLRLAAAPAIK